MILECEICHNVYGEIAKLPCGFYFEKDEYGKVALIMPLDDEGYRNICINCLLHI